MDSSTCHIFNNLSLFFTTYSWCVRIHFYCLLYSFWNMAKCSEDVFLKIKAECFTQHAIANQKLSFRNPENRSTCGAEMLPQNGSSIITGRWKTKLSELSGGEFSKFGGVTSAFTSTRCILSTFFRLFFRVSNAFLSFSEFGAWKLETVLKMCSNFHTK